MPYFVHNIIKCSLVAAINSPLAEHALNVARYIIFTIKPMEVGKIILTGPM